MLNTVLRPEPITAGDWHSAIGPHVGHDLIAHNNYGRLRIVVKCVAFDGRASLSTWADTYPEPVPELSTGHWRPDVSMPLFFGTRSVGCRTCQMPIAR
jgi:hypothetical protein